VVPDAGVGQERRVDLRPIITSVLPFADFDRAFELIESGTEAKVVLDLKGDLAK